jgi:tripeptidyl-peptidase-1
MTRNAAGSDAIKLYVTEKHGGRVLKETLGGEYITVEMKVSELEKLFATEFYEFETTSHMKTESAKSIRAASYAVPVALDEHIEFVFNTVHHPPPKKSERGRASHHAMKHENADKKVLASRVAKAKSAAADVSASTSPLIVPGYVTPGLIQSYYHIPSLQGSSLASQALFEAVEQSTSPSDLTYFQEILGATVNPIARTIGGHVYNDACVTGRCGEANLDVQYIMGVANNVQTVYNYWMGDDFVRDWIITVVNDPTPPSHVYSISYGYDEEYVTISYGMQFNTEAMKLSAMGVTIFVSSGDDGALSPNNRDDPSACFYAPSFPATSPYVVAVGASQGPEADPPSEEIMCGSPNGALITSGGGFSTLYYMPDWQASFVNSYLSTYNKTMYAGYNVGGRGIPDVTLFGHSYLVVDAGNFSVVDGTSASSPVMGAFASLVNSFRLSNGVSTLGWLTPLLYLNASSFAQDITSGGVNNCSAANGYNAATEKYTYNCCPQGFPTTPGWDATTGLGSVNYAGFFSAVAGTSMPSPVPSRMPTLYPTAIPTYSHAPSYSPTTHMPSISTAPTKMPTAKPTSATGDDDASINKHGSNNDDDGNYSEGTIAGIVIGSIIGVGLLAALCYYVFFVMTKGPLAAQGMLH